MLQNRVNPMGDIIRTPSRGAWMGNRGLIHNDKQQIIRPYRLIPWITCVLIFKNRRRKVMSPGLYTELFFLDEATAFSAGHRPCMECRRYDHLRFKRCWIKGNPSYHYNDKTTIPQIDAVIHSERIAADKTKLTYEEEINRLPDGTFVLHDEKPFLIKGDKMYPWASEGYGKGIVRPEVMTMTILTPRSIVNTFTAGYIPQMAL